MKVTLWGTRGSLATPGPEMARYGGNTSCVEVRGEEGTVLVLDAGTGIRRLGTTLAHTERRVDVLLTHLHLDHIQGLGFFAPLYSRDIEVHIWGPASTMLTLEMRLARYLSPPLFPIRLRELPCKPILHEVPRAEFEIGEFRISSTFVCHPGPTVGYRITSPGASLAYLPDHEPALGLDSFPLSPEWTSGYGIAAGVDLLIHDAQYSGPEYRSHIGWGHSSLGQALAFGTLAGVKEFIPFHHDPAHNDDDIDRLISEALVETMPPFIVTPGAEGLTMDIGASRA